jgi:hypothetical protein
VSGERRLDCPGSGQAAAKVFAFPVRADEGGQARQNLAEYGRGECPTCGRRIAVDLQQRLRPHATPAGGRLSSTPTWVDDRVIDETAPHPHTCTCPECARENADAQRRTGGAP